MTPRERDLVVLARTIVGEARGERIAGMKAVAWVVLNRAKRPERFGETIADVCLRPLQFSCWNPGDPNMPITSTVTVEHPEVGRLFVRCLGVAALCIVGEFEDLTNGADHYFSVRIDTPAWAKDPAKMGFRVQIGSHKFYKEIV